MVRRLFIISVLFNCFFCVPAQKIATIPFEQLFGGVILLKVQVGDKPDTLNFIFDSGSSHISLDSTTVAYLKLPVTKTDNYISGIGGIRKVSQVKNLSLKIDSLKIEALDYNINNYNILSESSGIRIDGIVGYAMISKYILNVNFDSSLINVYPLGNYKYPKKGYLWKYRMDYIPNTNIEIKDSRKINTSFYIDCGAGLGLLISERFQTDSLLYSSNKKILNTQIEGVGGKTNTKITVTKEMKIGPYKFKNVPTYIYNDSFDILRYPGTVGLIGNEILRRFNWVINYAKKEIFLTPNSFYIDPFDYSYTGLSIYLVDGIIRITEVMPLSPGFKAGFQVDDMLLSIENTIITSVKQAKDFLQNARKYLRVIVIRNNKPVELVIKVQSML
jgi:hypothetical protein